MLSFIMVKRLNIAVDEEMFRRMERLPGTSTDKIKAALEAWVPVAEKMLLEELKKEEGEHAE